MRIVEVHFEVYDAIAVSGIVRYVLRYHTRVSCFEVGFEVYSTIAIL